MDYTKYFSKKFLINMCILIIVIIIFRILYTTFISDPNNESFINNENIVADLLSKQKSYLITDNSYKDQLNAVSSNTDKELQIYKWSNQLYNIQNPSQQSKAISFYKPNLSIEGNDYYKLGDIVCQNADYTPPTKDQVSLLIKKKISDTKPPKDFFKMVEIDNTSNIVDTDLLDYTSYITLSSNLASINTIGVSLVNCVNTFTTLNSLIKNNLPTIKTNFIDYVYENSTVQIQADSSDTTNPISADRKFIKQLLNNKISNNGKISYSYDILPSTLLVLPAGIVGQLYYNSNISVIQNLTIPISIPSNLDSQQDRNINSILNKLYIAPFKNLKESNIIFNSIDQLSKKIVSLIPITEVINYIKSLCIDIQNIYINQSSNTKLLDFLNLAPNKSIIVDLLNKMNSYTDSDDINSVTIDNIINTSLRTLPDRPPSLIEIVLYIIYNFNIKYNLTKLTFNPTEVGFIFPEINAGTTLQNGEDIKNKNKKLSLIINDFNNDIIPNIPSSKYIITSNSSFNNQITNILPNITKFSQFLTVFNNKKLDYFPLQIYKPIPPDKYVALGHVFCNFTADLEKIIISNNVACVPSHCVKEVREWNTSDKVFEYNKNGKYWAIYVNPFTGTFVSTNVNAKQLPDGKVCKVVACVKKCTAVDDLQKADECSRKYYNLNKESIADTPLTSTLVSNQEEEFYLDKIKAQSDSITRLKTRAQNMQTDIDKATIVNREMNKSKLQNYVDTQKTNIDIIMKRLQEDKNKIQANVNIPLDTLNAIMQMIRGSSKISPEQKTALINKIIENQTMSNNDLITESTYNANLNNILNSCPQYDLTGLVKKQQASDVCYGCDAPK